MSEADFYHRRAFSECFSIGMAYADCSHNQGGRVNNATQSLTAMGWRFGFDEHRCIGAHFIWGK